MFANSTLGGFSNNGPTVRLSGITFAGTLEDALNISPRESLRNVQRSLNDLPSALPKLVVDGIMGAKTIARIKEFQRQNNLLETGVLTDPTTSLLAAKSFAARNAGVKSTTPLSSGEIDNLQRKVVDATLTAMRSAGKTNCRASLDGLRVICDEETPGFFDSIADSISRWLPGGEGANAAVDAIVDDVKDVAKAGAQGFGTGVGATLPFAPLVYVGGAVVGIILLKKFL